MDRKYLGDQTSKALKNFPFSGPRVHRELIYAIALIKKAAALANNTAGMLDTDITGAITAACDEILSGNLDSEFNLPFLQGGAGTSINMNVNEVVALRATEILGGQGKKITVHPNDHVNLAQSTNDVNPSALKIVCLQLGLKLLEDLEHVAGAFSHRAAEWKNVRKLARTHLQDAVPMTLGDEFNAYSATLRRDIVRVKQALTFFHELNLGGTAIGNKINAGDKYFAAVYRNLNDLTKMDLKPADNLISQTSSQTDFLALSQTLVDLTLDASKIASDIRILSSGPRGGLGEIKLTELQSGSSIMPGKVNPILPESVNQLFYFVSGNNLTIEHAAHAAQLELGVMFPIFADALIMSLKLTDEVLVNFADNCVATIIANPDRCSELLENSNAFGTLLTPVLGYDTVSGLVKESNLTGVTLRELLKTKNLLTDQQLNEILNKNIG
jgi:aspartate ammonia-lyase